VVLDPVPIWWENLYPEPGSCPDLLGVLDRHMRIPVLLPGYEGHTDWKPICRAVAIVMDVGRRATAEQQGPQERTHHRHTKGAPRSKSCSILRFCPFSVSSFV
jgi:hypothetical protein